MKLSQRIRLLLKTAVNDLFGEDQSSEVHQMINGETDAERLTSLLDDAQRQLDLLRLELNNAVSSQKWIEIAWRQAVTQVQAIDAAVDAAIKSGNDEQAREYLMQLNSASQSENELEELTQTGKKHSNDLRVVVNQQQEQLNILKRRTLALTDRERTALALSELLGNQQSLTRQTEKLHGELTVWEEQIARCEDLISARQEWNK